MPVAQTKPSGPVEVGSGRTSHKKRSSSKFDHMRKVASIAGIAAISAAACLSQGDDSENIGKAASPLSEQFEQPVTITFTADDANKTFTTPFVRPTADPNKFELFVSIACHSGCSQAENAQGNDVYKSIIDKNTVVQNGMLAIDSGSLTVVPGANNLDDDYLFQIHPDGKARFASSAILTGLLQECSTDGSSASNCINNIDLTDLTALDYVNGKIIVSSLNFLQYQYPYMTNDITKSLDLWTQLTTCPANTTNYAYVGFDFTATDIISSAYDSTIMQISETHIGIRAFDPNTFTCSGMESFMVHTIDPTIIKALHYTGEPFYLAGFGFFYAERDPNDPIRATIKFARTKTMSGGTGGAAGSASTGTNTTSGTGAGGSSTSTGGMGGAPIGGMGGMPTGGTGGVSGSPTGGMAGAPTGGTGGSTMTTTDFVCPVTVVEEKFGTCTPLCLPGVDDITIAMSGMATCKIEYKPEGFSKAKVMNLTNENKDGQDVVVKGNTFYPTKYVHWGFLQGGVDMNVIYVDKDGKEISIAMQDKTELSGNPNSTANKLLLDITQDITQVKVDGAPLECVGPNGVLTAPDSFFLNIDHAGCTPYISVPFECHAQVLTPDACELTECTSIGEVLGKVNKDKGTCILSDWQLGYNEPTIITFDIVKPNEDQLAGFISFITQKPEGTNFRVTFDEIFPGKVLKATMDDGKDGNPFSIIPANSGGVSLGPEGCFLTSEPLLNKDGTDVYAYRLSVEKGAALVTSHGTPLKCVNFKEGKPGFMPSGEEVNVSNAENPECIPWIWDLTRPPCSTSTPFGNNDSPLAPLGIMAGVGLAVIARRRKR